MKLLLILTALALVAGAFVVIPVWKRQKAIRGEGVDPSSGQVKPFSRLALSFGLLGLIVCAAFACYFLVGRPDLISSSSTTASAEPSPHGADPAPTMAGMIAQLQDSVRKDPNNAEAWQNLGWAYMHIRQPADAIDAYKHAVALTPGDTTYRSALVEAKIQSGDGKITPEILTDLRAVSASDPSDPRTKFYLALYKDQQGDHRGAIEDWVKLLKAAPVGAGWAAEVRQVITQVAKEQKIDIAAQLPPEVAPAPPAPDGPPGPSADQVAAASQMTAGDRQTMIHGMVDKLANELKQNPRDVDGWVRLMRARAVLGQNTEALSAYQTAKSTFARNPSQLATIESSARAIGVIH